MSKANRPQSWMDIVDPDGSIQRAETEQRAANKRAGKLILELLQTRSQASIVDIRKYLYAHAIFGAGTTGNAVLRLLSKGKIVLVINKGGKYFQLKQKE